MKDEKFNLSTGQSITQSITFWEALTITFIVLKLTHVVAWSWALVLAPLIAEVGIIIFVVIIMFMSDRVDKSNRW